MHRCSERQPWLLDSALCTSRGEIEWAHCCVSAYAFWAVPFSLQKNPFPQIAWRQEDLSWNLLCRRWLSCYGVDESLQDLFKLKLAQSVCRQYWNLSLGFKLQSFVPAATRGAGSNCWQIWNCRATYHTTLWAAFQSEWSPDWHFEQQYHLPVFAFHTHAMQELLPNHHGWTTLSNPVCHWAEACCCLQEEHWLVQHLVMEALQQYLRKGPPSVVPQHILNQGIVLFRLQYHTDSHICQEAWLQLVEDRRLCMVARYQAWDTDIISFSYLPPALMQACSDSSTILV